jgi:hypothetical protein
MNDGCYYECRAEVECRVCRCEVPLTMKEEREQKDGWEKQPPDALPPLPGIAFGAVCWLPIERLIY